MDYKFWLESTLKSYSIIFFSRKMGLGLVILVATMIAPSHGIWGITGALMANMTAFVLGFNRQEIRDGYWGFNGVLISLGLGLYYVVSLQLFLLCLAAVIFMTFFTAWVKSFLAAYNLPFMSIPFNLIFYIAILASFGSGYLEISALKWNLFDVVITEVPQWLNLFFKNLGAIFFNINPLSGIIISIGLLVFSRLSLLLIIVGWTVGYQIHEFLGVNSAIIGNQYLGFNYMLTALALGGVFVMPSLSSLVLAFTGVSIAAINLIALEIIFPDYLSSWALSFNITVLSIVYALKMRFYPTLGLTLTTKALSPEENLSLYRDNVKTERQKAIHISLPFYGSWAVTQAFNGEFTHKEEWAFGMDFMIKDEHGKLYSGLGNKLPDFHCYNAPLLAPAKGRVALIKNDTEDNKPGQTNPRDNWGNCVIIEHAPYFYSCLAHLKKDSFVVKEGETVEKGQVVGKCGNSGRSPYPHIHLQLQAYPYVGAPTLYFEFFNMVRHENEKTLLIPRGTLDLDDLVENINSDPDFNQYFPSEVSKEWKVEYQNGFPPREEIWNFKIDFHNNFYLEDNFGSKLIFDLSEGFLTAGKYSGKKNTALYFIGQTLIDIPFPKSDNELHWITKASLDALIPFYLVSISDFLTIFGFRFFLKITNLLKKKPGGMIILDQHFSIVLEIFKWSLVLKKYDQPREVIFKKGEGLCYAKDGEATLTLKTVDYHD